MAPETLEDELTWRLLWSHAAEQVIAELSINPPVEPLTAGYGYGLRRSEDKHRALLVHPTADDREAGDLSLTVLGKGTHVIPRAGSSYPQYISLVQDAVETAARTYLNRR